MKAVLTKVRQMALPKIEARGAIEASIIDDTGFPKKGKHSVGVARQYCGQLGKQDNCQAVVSLSIANHHASLPMAHRLYPPEAWANDPERRKQAKVPEDIVCKTKPQIALDQLRAAHAAGIAPGSVLADAGFGYDSQFREGITQLGVLYAVGIQSNVLMWKADAVLPVQGPEGQKPSRPQLRAQQVSAKELALSPAAEVWQDVIWRENDEAFTSRFARWRVRPVTRAAQPAEEWLVIEWPENEAEPHRSLRIPDRRSGDLPPSGPRKHDRSATADVSAGHRSEGAAAASRAACSELNRHAKTAAYCRSGRASAAVPMLPRKTSDRSETQLVTQ
jgi:SRSO17 transposase